MLIMEKVAYCFAYLDWLNILSTLVFNDCVWGTWEVRVIPRTKEPNSWVPECDINIIIMPFA